jgi:hypothetical protein
MTKNITAGYHKVLLLSIALIVSVCCCLNIFSARHWKVISTTILSSDQPPTALVLTNTTGTILPVSPTGNNGEQQTSRHHDNCTLKQYTNYYYSSTFPKPIIVPFSIHCLQSLVDAHPTNMPLRVGLVRANYEQQQQQPKQQLRRHVVYYCQKGCGGLGDRIRAAVNTFLLALAMNATFSICMEHPAQWDDFFLGLNDKYYSAGGILFQKFNLKTSLDVVPQLKNIPTIALSSAGGNWDYYAIKKTTRTTKESGTIEYENMSWFYETNMPQELFGKYTKNIDQDVVVLSQLTFRMDPFKHNAYAAQFWKNNRLMDLGRAERTFIFFRLFMTRPSKALKDALALYRNLFKGRFVVGVQIRLGGDVRKIQVRGWKDPDRHAPACIQSMAEKAREFCRTSTLKCIIWATSDTERALVEMQTIFEGDESIRVVVAKEPVTHIDRSSFEFLGRYERIKQNLRTFLDWYAMAEYSDAFVLSRSGFGEHASYFHMLNATHFKPAVQLQESFPCQFTDYRSIQNQNGQYRRQM